MLLWCSRAAAGSKATLGQGWWAASEGEGARAAASGDGTRARSTGGSTTILSSSSSLCVLCSRTTSAASTQTDRLCVCLSACLSACLSVCLSVCLSICLSICLSVYLSICTARLLQQDHNALAPGRRARSKEGHAEERKAAHARGEIDCKKEELEVPMGTARLVPSTSTCCAPFRTRAHVL